VKLLIFLYIVTLSITAYGNDDKSVLYCKGSMPYEKTIYNPYLKEFVVVSTYDNTGYSPFIEYFYEFENKRLELIDHTINEGDIKNNVQFMRAGEVDQRIYDAQIHDNILVQFQKYQLFKNHRIGEQIVKHVLLVLIEDGMGSDGLSKKTYQFSAKDSYGTSLGCNIIKATN
jgi:hypothetical protein